MLPHVEKGIPLFFVLIDNLRFDQWKTIQPIFAESFRIHEEETFYAILPTATQYARNAIFAGMMPMDIEKKFPVQWKNDDEEGGKNLYEEEFFRAQLQRLGRGDLKVSYTKVVNNQAGLDLGFADRRADRVVWPERQWQWASLRPENGTFDGVGYLDVTAREKWFYQAIAASPAMFRRGAGAGSVYWLGIRDADGAYLDGGRDYELRVPQPVPARLFWSITVYDAETRSQIDTDQGKAALRSLFELSEVRTDEPTRLRFGPEPPADGLSLIHI